MGQHAEHAVGSRDRVDGARDPCDDGEHRVGSERVSDDEVDHAPPLLRCIHRQCESVGSRVDEHALRERTEDRGDSGLETGAHLHGIADEAAHALATRSDDLGSATRQCERAAQSRCLRRQRVDFALGGVQALPKGLALGLRSRGGALCALVGGRVFGRRSFGRLRVVDGLEGLRGLASAHVRRLEGVLLTEHRSPDSSEGGCGGIRSSAQSRHPHVVCGDEGALLGDVDVERVEFGTRVHHFATGRCRRILGISETGRDQIDLLLGLVDRGLRDRDRGDRGVVVFGTEEGEPLIREREEATHALLHLLEAERHAACLVDGDGILILLQSRDARAHGLGLV